jgi:hypothetical protein
MVQLPEPTIVTNGKNLTGAILEKFTYGDDSASSAREALASPSLVVAT